MKKYFIILTLLFVSTMTIGNMAKQGFLVHEIGDSHDQRNISISRYYLQTEDSIFKLSMSDEFASSKLVQDFVNKNVLVKFVQQIQPTIEHKVQSIELLEGQARGGGVFGSQPWVSILCKFSDIDDEPRDLSFFEEMYSNTFSGLDHYWREVSYNQIDIIGSMAIDWVDLPDTQTSYIPEPGSNFDADLTKLFNDCTAAADPFVDFSDIGDGKNAFVGINMMFNETLDCCAWGGGRFATLDGLEKFWRVTWEPPWSFTDEAVIAHEMGHGFGLPHANNSDGDENTYDSPWGVMSSPSGNSVVHNVYGPLGKHINMYHKRRLNWVTDNDGFIASSTTDETITIDRTAIPSTENYRYALIPVFDGTYYIIESRFKLSAYEANLPGTAVIIHHVDEERNSPSWLIDGDNPPADFSNNEGSMWKVGETFLDPIQGHVIEIVSMTSDGFMVNIKVSDTIYKNGFE